MHTKREAAHAAARRGFDVFPIKPNAKKPPLLKSWQQKATQDPRQINAWWDEWPNANIGTPTDKFVIPDIDPRNGGKDTFEALMAVEDWPKTAVSNTAGGGNHIFYAAPEGRPIKGDTHMLGQGVDIKAGGGYVVLPGSTIDGRAYKWANGNEIARVPQWIVDQCGAATPKAEAAGKRLVEEDDIAIELFTKWVRDHAPHAELGEIDDTTFEVAAMGYDYGCSLDTVVEIVAAWNETHCDGLGDGERLLDVCESAGRNRGNAIGCRHPLRPGFEAVEIDEAKAPAPERDAPKTADGMKLERYFAAADKALSAQAEPLIKSILDRNAMSILYGESNTGKTFIAVDMAFHVAANLAWARCKVRQGCVVYVAAEGGVGVYKRLAALREHYSQIGDIPLFIVKYPVDLLHGKVNAVELVKLCLEAAAEAGLSLELIVIDTLSRAMSGGDENSSTDMGAMVKSFDAIREATRAHLMVIHHSGKDRAKGARGHSLLRAATDTEIEIERGKLTVTKQRDMEGDFSQAFRLKNVPIGLDADGAVVSSCVVELMTASEAAAIVVPPTPAEAELAAAIRTRMGRLGVGSFGWQFVPETYLELAWRKGASEGAVYKVLQTLQSKGLVTKTIAGQYVTIPPPTLQILQT